MRNLKYFIVCLFGLGIAFDTFGQEERWLDDLHIAKELAYDTLYVELFPQIYLEEISDHELELINAPNTVDKQDIVEFINYYNDYLRRELNEELKSFIFNEKYHSHFIVGYARDFDDLSTEQVRFVFKTEMSAYKLYEQFRKRSLRLRSSLLSVHLYDRLEKVHYKAFTTLPDALGYINQLYQFSDEHKSFEKMSQKRINTKVDRQYKKKKGMRSRMSTPTKVVAVTAVLTLFYLKLFGYLDAN